MFRLPKSSNQSPARKTSNLVVNPIVNVKKKDGLCRYAHRKCNFVCLDNYDYCLKHILEDKSAPYKPCPFLYTVSGKKCGKPALRQERKDTWFCPEHNRKSLLQRQRASSRHAPPKTQETLFATLGHYAPPDQPTIKREEVEDEEAARKKVKTVDPFVDIDASQVNARTSSRVLDYISESDSDVDTAMLDSVWRAQDQESSDAESVDSQNEDPLKHAETYTAEEVTVIIKDKMLRLQSLYIDQFRRLHHLLKEKRRKYLHTLKKEKETLCSIHDQEKQTAREQKLYQKLKALNRYHKHYGVEAILHKKALELRAQVTEGHQLRTSHKGKCAFTEGGVKCGAKTLPVTKYCRKHILEDTQQVLFRSCGVKRDDHICHEPTLNVFEKCTCVYHTVLPAQPHDKLKRSDPNEIQMSEGDTQSTLNESENSFVNVVDSEELLIKEILKPDESGKTESVDALELSRTVSDILALAEAHSSSTGLDQTAPIVDHDVATTSTAALKSFTEENIEALCNETNKLATISNDTPPCGSSTAGSDQNMEVLPSESSDERNTTLDVEMDVENKLDQPVSLDKESSKQETSEDLVMVDMMTDVGVVEEVLESEQMGVDSEEVVSSGQDLGGGEQETGGSGLKVSRSEEMDESNKQLLGSEQKVEEFDNKEIKSDQQAANKVIEIDEPVVETHEQVVETHEQVVDTHEQVIETHEQVAETHKQLVKTHEQVTETHEQVVETHEQVVDTHEQVIETHEQVTETHKQLVKAHEQIVETHEQVVETHEQVVETHEQVTETHEQVAEFQEQVVDTDQQASSVPEHARLKNDRIDEKFEEPMEVVVENENELLNG